MKAISKPTIYLDSNATTPPDPRVLERMREVEAVDWANPSSSHRAGKKVLQLIEEARESVASLVGARHDEIIFTSGATESVNLALKGVYEAIALNSRPCHIVTSLAEHDAVRQTIRHLASRHACLDVTWLQPDGFGGITPEAVSASLRENTVLVALMHGNNEIGTLNPLRNIGSVLQNHPAYFFVDAAQTIGYCPPSVSECGIALMALSAHKMHGPKGIGALYARRDVQTILKTILHGGGQEFGLRSGTPNVSGIIGLGEAAAIVAREREDRTQYVVSLRECFLNRVRDLAPDVRLNGHPVERLPGNISLTIDGVDGLHLMAKTPHLIYSRGSACAALHIEPSHVLKAINLDDVEIYNTVRLGISAMNTVDEINSAATDLGEAIRLLRGQQSKSGSPSR